MLNNLFKTGFIIIGICLIMVLFGIYSKMSSSRYQPISQASGVELFDTQTNDIYSCDGDNWYKFGADGKEVEVKNLPK